MATGMLIDGVAASEAIDSSGEILDIEGCDISTLDTEGVLNWEHRGDEAPGHSPSDIVGRIVFAKKVFSEKDCSNARERLYWDQVELPFIYIVARLYDGAGHTAAKDMAAQIRDHLANGESILVRYSIEGTTLKHDPRDKKHLLESVARRVAATIKPCNRSCSSGVIEDPNAPEGFEKKPGKVDADFLDEILKRSEHFHPNFTPLGGARVVECNPVLPDDFAKSELFTKNDPPQDEGQYLPMRQWHNQLRSQYVKDGEKVASSRTVPYGGQIPAVGTWGIDDMHLNYGREISQLREVNPKHLVPSEHLPEREPDVQQYAQWTQEGKQAPPIDVVETDGGQLKISDGHRRWRAAQHLGQDKMLAWVSPTAPHPEGLNDSGGKPMKVGLTYELAAGKPYKKTEGADAESDLIAERRETQEARAPHRFRAAEWTHPNGHPRCRLCGDEERVGGKCPGADHDGLKKTLTAGDMNAAPGTLTGGAALQREDAGLRGVNRKMRLAMGEWDGKKDLKSFLKHRVPEASDAYIDRFSQLVDEFQLKKAESRTAVIRKFEALAIDLRKAIQDTQGTPQTVEFWGRQVSPGSGFIFRTGKWEPVTILYQDEKLVMAVPAQFAQAWTPDNLMKLPRSSEGSSLQIQKPAREVPGWSPTDPAGHQPISYQNVYDVYFQDGDKYQPSGRVMTTDGQNMDVLADYHGHLQGQTFQTLQANPSFRVVSREDYRQGKHADLIPEQHLDPDPNGSLPMESRPPSVFQYVHPALSQSVTLECRDGQTLFNGQPLSEMERQRIVGNIRSRAAVIRYKRDQVQASVAKMESLFQNLMKVEPHIADALNQLRGAVKSGHVHPDVLKHLTSEIFVDPMVKGVGNKKAYADFLSRPKQGVHVRMDGNDFGQINKIHSFEHGNQAITHMGQAMREAMDETVGSKHGKLFRIGGDEFAAHVPTHEHAAQFARTLRAKLEKIPPVGGTHALSVSMGFGHTPEHSDQASLQAKAAKKAAGYQPGQAKTHAFSAVPGFEGHIPMDPEQLPIAKPKDVGAGPEQPTGGAPSAPHAAVTPPGPEQPKAPQVAK